MALASYGLLILTVACSGAVISCSRHTRTTVTRSRGALLLSKLARDAGAGAR